MTNEEKQVVLKALERGKISGKDRSYFEKGETMNSGHAGGGDG